MNILWIEDFGGGLDSGTATLNLMFQELVSFENLVPEEFSLLSRPNDLERFFKDNSVLHCVFLCRHYFDYIDFKTNNDLTRKIDSVIIDIRLDNNVDLSLPIPSTAHTEAKFHEEAGFYIFNDLVHLGFPAKKICFMTGEKNSFIGFKKQCDEIYIPSVIGFEKYDAEYVKLRTWIKEQESDYVILRRGVIEGCNFLKSHIEKHDGNIQFRDFIKIENGQPTIEIPTIDIKNYLDALAQFLPCKSSDLSVQYKFFLRSLVHEWEENIETKWLKEKYGNDLSKIRDIYTFAWLMKMTRNWVSHANLLEPLTPQIIAFLFLANMRAMFKLPRAIQPYEKILLSCFSLNLVDEINEDELKDKLKDSEQNISGILAGLGINDSGHFGEKINAIYRQNTGNPDAESLDFNQFLLQYFWINQKTDLRNLIASSDDFLPALARHIYKYSFA